MRQRDGDGASDLLEHQRIMFKSRDGGHPFFRYNNRGLPLQCNGTEPFEGHTWFKQ